MVVGFDGTQVIAVATAAGGNPSQSTDAESGRGHTESSSGVNQPSSSFTLSQWTLIFVLGTINVCAAMIYSIQAPFYPAEAESKNCTATEYGLVFGSYELTTFIACPIVGSCMYKLGSKLSYHLGLIFSGSSVILFGFLPFLDDHLSFLAASFSLRITEAIGASIVFIATATIVTMQFPDSVATIFATLELTFGIGFAIGPTVGSALYELDGFSLPFIALGGTLLFLNIVTCFILPKAISSPSTTATHSAVAVPVSDNNSSINNNNSVSLSPSSVSAGTVDNSPGPTRGYAFLDLMSFASINLYSFSNFVAAVGVGFLTATLEPQLRKYKLHKVMTGFIFFLYGGVYALMAPFVGKLCDRIPQPIYVTLVGAALSFTGFMFLGPAPFLGIKSLLWVTIISLVLIGFGLAGVYVSTFLLTLQEAKRQGFPDTATTSSLVSALWMSCISLGCFVGPSAAGLLVDHFGFRHATYFVLTLNSFVILFILSYIFAKRSYLQILIIFDYIFAERSCGVRRTQNVPADADFVDDELSSLLANRK